MAGDALQVDAHEVLEQHHGHLVGRVFVHDLGAVVAELRPTDEIARRADVVVAARRGGDQLADEFIEGLIELQRVFDVGVEDVATLPTDAILAGAPQVEEVVRPLFLPLLRSDELVDQLVALGRVGVFDEMPRLQIVRDAAGQVEMDAPEERGVVGQGRMGNAVALHLAEDVVVDEVAPDDLDRFRISGRDGGGQLGRLGAVARSADVGMVGRGLRRLLSRRGPGRNKAQQRCS